MKKVAVGIDIGGTNSAYGLVDEQGNILCEGVFPTRNFPDADLYIEELYIGIQNLLKTSNQEFELIGVVHRTETIIKGRSNSRRICRGKEPLIWLKRWDVSSRHCR